MWTKTHPQDSKEQLVSDQKSSDAVAKIDGERTPSDEKEKSQKEYQADTSEKKQTSSDTKTSCSRYFTTPKTVLTLYSISYMVRSLWLEGCLLGPI